MASAIRRVKITYRQGSLDASEIYWSSPADLSTNTGAAIFTARLNVLLELRKDMMFTTHSIRTVEISDVTDPRKSILLRGGQVHAIPKGSGNTVSVPATGSIGLTSSNRPEQMKVAVLAELGFDGGTRRSRRYISSVPDDVTAYDDNTVSRTSKTTWWEAWQAFSEDISNGYWQVYGRAHTGKYARQDVQRLVPASPGPGLIALQLDPSAVTADWQPGVEIYVQGFKAVVRTCPCPTINRLWVIDSVGAAGSGLVYLRGSTPIDPAQWKKMGNAALRGYGYFLIEDADIVGTATHKRGNGSKPRGKQRTTCCVP